MTEQWRAGGVVGVVVFGSDQGLWGDLTMSSPITRRALSRNCRARPRSGPSAKRAHARLEDAGLKPVGLTRCRIPSRPSPRSSGDSDGERGARQPWRGHGTLHLPQPPDVRAVMSRGNDCCRWTKAAARTRRTCVAYRKPAEVMGVGATTLRGLSANISSFHCSRLRRIPCQRKRKPIGGDAARR